MTHMSLTYITPPLCAPIYDYNILYYIIILLYVPNKPALADIVILIILYVFLTRLSDTNLTNFY